MMKAYQCSRCTELYDNDEYCMCMAGIDPRPNHRQKGDAKVCKQNFKPLVENQIWNERFSWESK